MDTNLIMSFKIIKKLPDELIYLILSYDERFVLRNGRLLSRLNQKTDPRYLMLSKKISLPIFLCDLQTDHVYWSSHYNIPHVPTVGFLIERTLQKGLSQKTIISLQYKVINTSKQIECTTLVKKIRYWEFRWLKGYENSEYREITLF